MYRVRISTQWELSADDGRRLHPRLMELLRAVHERGSLAAAARAIDLSYRYAWGMLQEAGKLFGRPLLRSQRGRGTGLSALGERLVWADSRINARLSPTLDSLASELEAELDQVLLAHAAPLRLHASHGFGVEALRRIMMEQGMPLELKYRSPDDALAALRSGACDLAGLHLPMGELEGELLGHYSDRLDIENDRLINLAMRRQGLVLAAGNPQGIRGLSDLVDSGLRFIHRQPGSGTRLLLEALLARQGLAWERITPCDVEELTHAAVAAYVASGLADAGFALEPPARRYSLDFIPLVTERYFFVCRAQALAAPALENLMAVLTSDRFRRELALLPGYDASLCGQVQRVHEAFPSLASGRKAKESTPPA